MAGVFVNYRTGDGDWAATLVARELAKRFGTDMVFYASRTIRLGEDFVEAILKYLAKADVLLVLIGSRWLSATRSDGQRRIDDPGDWVHREIREGFEHGLRVIPVLLDGVRPLVMPDLPEDIAALARCQYVRLHHRNDDRDMARLLEDLTELVPGLAALSRNAVPDREGSDALVRRFAGAPYRGLLPFDHNHQGVFYGRERLTDELVDRVAERLTGPGLLMVTGASGAGKSSLVQAGLVPAVAGGRVAAGCQSWPRVVMTPSAHPVDELAVRLAALAGVTASSVRDILFDRPHEVPRLIRQTVLVATTNDERDAQPSKSAARLLLVVDQFEELFTRTPATQPGAVGQREAFVAALCTAATTGVGPANEPALLVVIAVRSDFWHHCLAVPALGDLMRSGQFIVGPMTEPELRRAITGPATAAGLHVEPELTDLILADLRAMSSPTGFDVGALPLLSQAMLTTWEHRDGDRLTIQAYGATGGVANAITTTAERVYTSLSPDDQAIAKAVFHHLATAGVNGGATRRTATRFTLYDSTPRTSLDRLDAILHAFAAERLLILDNGNVDIAHDSLLIAWHRLQEWLAEDHTDRLIHHQLLDDAARWQHADHDKAFLYRGTELTTARNALVRWDTNPDRHPTPTAQIRRFMHTSTRIDRRTATLRRTAITTLVLLIIATSITAFIAITTARQNRHEQLLALSRQLAARADAIAHTDPGLAQRLAAAAWHVAPTPEARYSMVNSLATRQRAVLTGHTAPIRGVAFSPDGKTLATSGNDKTARLWDVTTRRQIGASLAHTNSVYSVAFSPDGGILATASADNTVHLWDVSSRRQIGDALTGHTQLVHSVVFSPDGTTVATASNDRTVRLWDVASHRQIGAPVTVDATGVAFSPDSGTVATASRDRTVRLWEVASQRQIGDPLTHTTMVTGVAYKPDGRTIATTDLDHAVHLWDVSSRRQIGDALTGHTAMVQSIDFSPDGATIATASIDRTVRLWDVAAQRQIGEPLTGHTADVFDVAFSPNSRTLATAGADWTVRLWDVATRRQTGRPLSLGNETVSFGNTFSPDGRTLATVDNGQEIRLWDITTGRRTGAPDIDYVTSAAFSPTGRTIAIVSSDHAVRLWDVTARRQIGKPLTGHTDYVTSAAFSPDGRTLVTTSQDHTIRLWDVTTHRQTGNVRTHYSYSAANAAFSPDGRTIVVTSNDDTPIGRDSPTGTARLWDAATLRQIGSPLTGHADDTVDVAFSPDGETVVTTSADQTVRLWDVATRRQIGNPLTGHTDTVTDVAFSPDGKTIATTSADQTVRLWDVATRQQIADPLTGHTDTVTDVAFSPDGETVATISGDGIVRTWNTGFEPDPLVTICRHAGSVTPDEWAQQGSGEPLPDVC